MPIYEYKCSVCGNTKEVITNLNISLKLATNCIKCDIPMEKQFSKFETRHSSDTIRSSKR